MSEIFFSMLTSDWCKPHQEQQENFTEASIGVIVVIAPPLLSPETLSLLSKFI